MRHFSIFFLSLISALAFGQSSEFTVHPSGLIYSDTTMGQLHYIVDSLNIKFKSCDLHKTYRAKAQARAHYVTLEKGDIKQARKDMKNDMSLEDFIKKHHQVELERDLLVVKWKYENYDGEEVVEFSEQAFDGDYGREIRLDDPSEYDNPRAKSWVMGKGTSSLRAFYFPEEFKEKPLPEKYARMVLYSECMVDTNAQIFKENASSSGGYFDNKKSTKVVKFMEYVHQETGMPGYPEGDSEEGYKTYARQYRKWDSTRMSVIERELSKQDKFKSLLKDAVAEAQKEGGSNDEFEGYVSRFHSPAAALDLKRSRRVMGMCSMDDSPRVHAMNIAVLSAETINWETFLRAHLNIMNDRFERMSDGSYAWGRRQTYIRELEELEINVSDLLLGISLRVENPGQNHYYGSIGRLGRALAETQHPEKVEAIMEDMIRDKNLDDYNRLLIYFLYLNYNHHLDDETKKEQGMAKLNLAVQELPAYMAGHVGPEE